MRDQTPLGSKSISYVSTSLAKYTKKRSFTCSNFNDSINTFVRSTTLRLEWTYWRKGKVKLWKTTFVTKDAEITYKNIT